MKNNKKRKISFLDLALLLATFLLTVASLYFLYLYKGEPSKKNSVETKEELLNTSIDEIESIYPGIKIVREISNDQNTPFAIQYPQSEFDRFNDQVKKYIEKLKYKHLNDIATYETEDPSFESELNISFETFEYPSGIYSFVIISNRFIGRKPGEMDIRTFHLNNENGETFHLQNIFKRPDKDIEQLAKLTREKIVQDRSLKNFASSEEIKKETEPNWDNYTDFALTEDGLVLYLTHFKNKHNFPIVSIPYGQLKDILKERFYYPIEEENEDGKESPSDPSDDQALSEEDEEGDGKVETEQAQEDNPPEEPSNGAQNNDEQGQVTKKRVALTFDDGPDPDVTPRILRILEKYDAKATFYMLGGSVEYYPDVAKMVQAAGHELGNHSWTHPDLTKASNEKIYNEVNRTSNKIEKVTGTKPLSFRPPYGALDRRVRQQINLPITLWDVDTLDWKHRNPQQILNYVRNQTKDGSIILMHDIHPTTADGLDAVMQYLIENGYEFVTVSEINK